MARQKRKIKRAKKSKEKRQKVKDSDGELKSTSYSAKNIRGKTVNDLGTSKKKSKRKGATARSLEGASARDPASGAESELSGSDSASESDGSEVVESSVLRKCMWDPDGRCFCFC